MTPKQQLLTDKVLADDFLKLADSVTFYQGSRLALLQVVAEMSDVTDPVLAAAAYHRIMGARKFLDLLHSIATPVKPLEGRSSPGLDYRA